MSDKEPGAYVDLNENNLMIKLPRKMIFGSFEVPRCQAKSKRSGLQCRKAAMQGKRVCRTHGGASTGPKTIAGRQRCAAAKTVHGRETRAIREARDVKLRELREMEQTLKNAGLI